MGTLNGFMTADHSHDVVAPKASTGNWFTAIVARLRHEAQDRRLRDQLADMDDAMLRDIGIADDELHMIRARDRFTPRAWAASRSASAAGWEF